MEQEVRKALVTGDVVAPGPVLVRAAAWPRLVADVHAVVSAATGQRDEALAARAGLEDTIREQRQRLEERRAALHEARTEQTQQRSESTQRLAVSLFKTVAAALDDSFESQSLGSLQDQVLAAMARLRIRPMLTVGEVTAFDPDHHAWTGEGYPPREVVAITPGFVAELEGGEELVLAFARVGAPTEGQGRA